MWDGSQWWPFPEVDVYRRVPHADARRIAQVLAGLEFPAAKWQLVTYAEEYGADAATRADLWSLPVASYPGLPAVLATLGLVAPPARWRRRPVTDRSRANTV